MKKTIAYLLISTLVFGCTKEDPQETQTNSAPVSPTALKATLTGSAQVSLKWNDNSSNEEGFRIERQTGTGPFSQVGVVGSNVTAFTDTGLVNHTEYVYRVVAFNATGNGAYSNLAVIGVYAYVQIGTAFWMQQNLDVEYYRNGDLIPQVTDPTKWANLTTGAWCYYQNNTANGVVYGKLYNWYAVNDPRGLAPKGWHVATNSEWITLTNELGGTAVAGGALKSTEYWTSPNTGATNSSGFTAVGGGARIAQAAFANKGIWGAWWTADNDTEGISFYRIVYNDNTKSEGYHIYNQYGMSVRCVKD